MKSLLLVLFCVAVVCCSLPAVAGPLTGAPAIKFYAGGAEEGAAPGATWGLGLGYTTFDFELVAAGKRGSWKPTGPIVSGEVGWPVGKEGKQSFALGGWYADAKKSGGSLKAGQISGRYNWNQNWGLEIGLPLKLGGAQDANLKDLIGTMFHVTYQMKPISAPGLALQFGLGGAGSGGGMARDGYTTKTDLSLYSNATYAFSENVNGTLSLWYLKQKWSFDPTFGLPTAGMNLLHWSLGVGYRF